MSDGSRVDRREALRRAGLAVLALTGAACKSSSSGPSSCIDTTGLTTEQVQARTALGYQDVCPPDVTRSCLTCQQYLKAPESDRCGGCKLIAGPIHPRGTCKVYAPA